MRIATMPGMKNANWTRNAQDFERQPGRSPPFAAKTTGAVRPLPVRCIPKTSRGLETEFESSGDEKP